MGQDRFRPVAVDPSGEFVYVHEKSFLTREMAEVEALDMALSVPSWPALGIKIKIRREETP